jgi:hypothetical protein
MKRMLSDAVNGETICVWGNKGIIIRTAVRSVQKYCFGLFLNGSWVSFGFVIRRKGFERIFANRDLMYIVFFIRCRISRCAGVEGIDISYCKSLISLCLPLRGDFV